MPLGLAIFLGVDNLDRLLTDIFLVNGLESIWLGLESKLEFLFYLLVRCGL